MRRGWALDVSRLENGEWVESRGWRGIHDVLGEADAVQCPDGGRRHALFSFFVLASLLGQACGVGKKIKNICCSERETG